MTNFLDIRRQPTQKSRITLFDILIFALIVSSLSLYDIKLVFLGIQALAFFMTFLHVIANSNHWHFSLSFFVLWWFAFSFWSLLSFLWTAPENSTALMVTLSVVQVGLIAFCILFYCAFTRKMSYVLYALITSAVLLCVRFFIEVPTSMWGQETRFEDFGVFGSNNPAMILAYAAVVLIWMCFFKEGKIKFKVPALLLVILFMFITMLMGTKKSLLIFGVCLLILMLGTAKNPVKLFFRVFLIITAVFLLYVLIMNVPVLYSSIGYRIESMFSLFEGGETDRSTASRASYMQHAFEVFLARPIGGVGQDGYRYVNVNNTYSHNNFTEVLANLGFVGFATYYAFYIFILKKSFSIRKKNLLPLCLVLSILISDIAMVSYASESMYAMAAITLSMAILSEDARQRTFECVGESFGSC